MANEAVATVEAGAEAPGRRQAWVRAGAGISLILVLLGALSVLERGQRAEPLAKSEPAPQRAQTPGPAPNIVTEAREPLIGTAVALPAREEALPVALKADGVVAEPAPEESAAPEIAAQGQRQADAPPPTAANADALEAGAKARPVEARAAAPEPDAVEPPVRADKPAAQLQAAQGGFLVQLGVFGVGSNAASLHAELERLGVPARLETRVVAGPFATRKAADEASEKLVRAGLVKGMVVKAR